MACRSVAASVTGLVPTRVRRELARMRTPPRQLQTQVPDRADAGQDTTSEHATCEPPTDPAVMRALYWERAHLVAALSTHPAVIDAVLSTDEAAQRSDCATVTKLDTVYGQLTWHIYDGDLGLFAHLPRVAANDPRAAWDGHDTEEKLRRLDRLTQSWPAAG
jgi:hypothetical protein